MFIKVTIFQEVFVLGTPVFVTDDMLDLWTALGLVHHKQPTCYPPRSWAGYVTLRRRKES